MGWDVGGYGWDMWDMGVWGGTCGHGVGQGMGCVGTHGGVWDGMQDGDGMGWDERHGDMWGYGMGCGGMGWDREWDMWEHGGGMGWDAGWDRGWDGMRDMGTCGVMGWDVDGMWDVGVRDGAGDGRYGDMGRDRGRDV